MGFRGAKEAFRAAAVAVLAAGVAAAAGAEPKAADLRFLNGAGVVGVLKPSDVAKAPGGPVGFVAIYVKDRFYEGVYNLKDEGRAVIGALWPEGLMNGTDVSAVFELRIEAGGVARGEIAMTGGPTHKITAR